VRSSAWVTVLNRKERQHGERVANPKLRTLILTNFDKETIVPDPSRKVVIIGDGLEVPVKGSSIDDLARQSGLVIGSG
jgi:hypothetical protein